MRRLSGVAIIFIQLTDLSSGLRVVMESSCFSDRNIWDFLSPEAAVSWYFSPFLCSEPTVSDIKALKRKAGNVKSITNYFIIQLYVFREFQVEYI